MQKHETSSGLEMLRDDTLIPIFEHSMLLRRALAIGRLFKT